MVRRLFVMVMGSLMAVVGLVAPATADVELTVRSAVEQNAQWISEHGFGASIAGLDPGTTATVRLDGVVRTSVVADELGTAYAEFPAQPVVDGQELVVEAEDIRGRIGSWTITARARAQWYIETTVDAAKASEPIIMVGFLRAGYPGTPGRTLLDNREVDAFHVGESHTADIAIPGGLTPGRYALVVELETGERYEGVIDVREGPSSPEPPAPPAPPVAPDASQLTEDRRGGVVAPARATAGQQLQITVGTNYAGREVDAWLFPGAMSLGRHAVRPDGTITVTLPAGVTGEHRIAITGLEGDLLGWAPVSIDTVRAASSATLPRVGGGAAPEVLALAAALAVSGVAVWTRASSRPRPVRRR